MVASTVVRPEEARPLEAAAWAVMAEVMVAVASMGVAGLLATPAMAVTVPFMPKMDRMVMEVAAAAAVPIAIPQPPVLAAVAVLGLMEKAAAGRALATQVLEITTGEEKG